MDKLSSYLKKYPVSCIYILFIWVLSLCPIFPHTGLENVRFIDKWTHLVMYAGTCLTIWVEYLRLHEKICKQKIVLFAIIAPTLMSALLELLQAYCTGGRRSGEWLDLAANATGVVLAALIGALFLSKKIHPKH